MTMHELAPPARPHGDDGAPYCPRCVEESDAIGPLTADRNDQTRATTVTAPGAHVIDMAGVVDDVVYPFVVICERHDLACVFSEDVPDGWVVVRIETDHGEAHARIPESCIETRPVEPDHPEPEGYGHVYRLGERHSRKCSECGDPAAMLARDPDDPDTVDHPRGAFFCDDCAAAV